jgi:hypothetical protein
MRLQARRGRLLLGALAAALAVLALGATGAQAKLVKVTGSTTVTPSQGATQFLSNAGVSVSTVGTATSGAGGFTFPVFAGFGDTKTYNGLLAHSGGLRFSKGERSVVLRRFVAVRLGKRSALLAQIPGAKGGCGHIASAARRFAKKPDRARYTTKYVKLRYPNAAKRVVQATKAYCKQGKVIVLATLSNLGKSVEGGTATLTADLNLSAQAARLVNRVAGSKVVAKGALLGTGTSTVTKAG